MPKLSNFLPFLGGRSIPEAEESASQEHGEVVKNTVDRTEKKRMPIQSSRRSSVPAHETSLFNALQSRIDGIIPDYHVNYIKTIRHLVTYNGDYSYALDNIVQLANTKWSLDFGKEVPYKEANKMTSHLKIKGKSWYPFSGGLNGLINDIFAQIVIAGCISAETVPQKDLRGVAQVVLPQPETIRFVYDASKDVYLPYQSIADTFTGISTPTSMIKLNPYTYHYVAYRRFSEKPYAIPPFVSALDGVVIEDSMIKNFDYIVKQIGVFGFLKVLLEAPAEEEGETDSQYYARCQKYLSDVEPEITKSLNNGVFMGFKDKHDVDIGGKMSDAEGAKVLFELVNQIKMSGLKQDPLMLGRNYQTTETLAKVIVMKLSEQIVSFQQTCASFLENLFLLELQLSGYSIYNLNVKFQRPTVGDQIKEEQAEQFRIKNAIYKYNQGIWSQEQVARALGEEEPDQKEPRVSIDPGKDAQAGGDKDPDDGRTNPAKVSKNYLKLTKAARKLGAETPEFVYDHECSDEHCNHVSFNDAFGDDEEANQFFEQYTKSTLGNYDEATRRLAIKVGEALGQLGQGATVQTVTDTIIYTIYTNWNIDFTERQKATIRSFVDKVYRYFRRDITPFGDLDPTKLPDAVFNLVDLRTIEYFKKSDEFYLGKFVTDQDTRKRMTAWIKERYEAGRLPIGGNRQVLADFQAEFPNMFKGETYKINRIINTTISRLRTSAHIQYLDQYEVERYVIRGISDGLQCGYCALMQGKTFSVKKSINRINSMVESEPETVLYNAPFVTQFYPKPADMANVAEDVLERQNLTAPPFHPNCRDSIVADI